MKKYGVESKSAIKEIGGIGLDWYIGCGRPVDKCLCISGDLDSAIPKRLIAAFNAEPDLDL